MHKFNPKFIAYFLIITSEKYAFSHPNHGLQDELTTSHWHTTDVWGFVALASVIAIAVWLSRGGK
jgi:hypothetical protein